METSKSTGTTVSVVMISFNDENIIGDCLSSIRQQDYPQNLIEIVLVDGGSTDKTIDIASKYDAIIISRPDLRDKPSIRGGIALTRSKSDLVLFFSADNRLDENSALRMMVEGLQQSNAFAAESLRYGYRKSDPALSRYFALIGGTDPVAIALGKADRKPYDHSSWSGYGEALDCGSFYKVKFKKNTSKIPTLGANGFLFKRHVIENSKYAKSAFHIDMCAEAILNGHDTVLFFKNIHTTHYLDIKLLDFIKRRILYANMYQGEAGERIYKILDKTVYFKLFLYIIFSLTIIPSFLRSCKGFIAFRDFAWFLHPITCIAFTIGYGRMFIKNIIKPKY